MRIYRYSFQPETVATEDLVWQEYRTCGDFGVAFESTELQMQQCIHTDSRVRVIRQSQLERFFVHFLG